MSSLLDDEDFKNWVYEHGRTIPAATLVDDDVFLCRMLNDVLFGRSKSFNRSNRGADGPAGGLQHLYQEYRKEREDEEKGV